MNRRFRVKQKTSRSGIKSWGVFDRMLRRFYPLTQRKYADSARDYFKTNSADGYGHWKGAR